MTLFDLNQTWKIVPTENCSIWSFFAKNLLSIIIKDLTKVLQL